jgi:hypothetical protein
VDGFILVNLVLDSSFAALRLELLQRPLASIDRHLNIGKETVNEGPESLAWVPVAVVTLPDLVLNNSDTLLILLCRLLHLTCSI